MALSKLMLIVEVRNNKNLFIYKFKFTHCKVKTIFELLKSDMYLVGNYFSLLAILL